jgi:predicted metal-binding membrane protein
MLGLAALAWAGVIAYAQDMGNGAGTMGIDLGEFVAMWSLMMAAMMLPAVAPVAALYVRTIRTQRARRVTLFVAGYLVVWASVGFPAYVALSVVDDRADAGTTMRAVAAVVLVVAGLYQLTPLKAVCLRHCRSPLGQLLHYGNVKGRGRDVRVAVHRGSALGAVGR